ncbi:hypothetical protein F5146DRAFT_1140887 [Armillaria mellea]|nr:hypothetical protein F5146DRAFT_1140887 [Armillaria mellea]
MQISPWFDIAAWLKPLRGSKTASIQVALDAIAHVESMVSLPSTSNNNEDASAVEDKHAVAGGLEKAEDIQITVADNGMPVKTKAGADADKSPSEEERVPKKCKKKTKKKSQDLASEDNDVEESRAVSSAHAFKHHKPLPFRLSKSELKVYTDNGADDEDYVWHQGFLQASHTKGPVMDAVQRPLCIKRSVAPVSPDLPPKSLPQLPINNWGWNSWMARELGDLDMPIQVHELVQHVTDSSNWSTKPTMEITSSLRTVLEESLKGNKGKILNALTLTMPDTMLQSSLFLQHPTWMPARAPGQLGLASNAGTITPPHTDFSGSAIKINVLTGCKVWFVISKHQEDKRGKTWDMFVRDFQADSKINSEVYKCEILLLESGTLWFEHPNMLHAVATQANSLVFGQHFFLALAIWSVVMRWVHTAFLSWAITNVEHKDMRILLLRMMAHWKKVITAGEPLEEHDSHVPDLHMQEGLLDVCALGNLLIYLPALSKCQDEYWDDLHFAFMQYWELVSWGNEHLALTGMDGSNDVYELYVAVKLSALQFGLALLDYHTSVADSPLYEALDSGDQFNCIWFQSDVLGAFDQTFGKELQQEQRKKRHQPEDNLFWDILFNISTVKAIPDDVHIISYDELPPIEEETDSSASSSLTDLLESEPLQSPPPAPAMMLVSMASPSRKALANTKSINDWNTSKQEAQDEEKIADYEDEDVGDNSDNEERQADDDADTNGSNSAFLDNLESTSQVMWQVNDEERDDSIEDVADSLSTPAQDGWQIQEEQESLSPGTEFNLALAMIETPPDMVMTSEGAPQMTGWLRHPSGPEGKFNGGRLEDDFNHFLNPDAFAQGETDEGVLRDIEHEPLAHIHSLDMPGEISHLAKESSEVLHLSQTADLTALISTTSHSLMMSLPMPQALIDNLFQMSVSSSASEDVADAISEDKFHDVIEVSFEEENAQPELLEELMLWQEQMKTTLQDYLKDKQPLGAIKVEESARCDTLQHESPEELVLGHEQRRKELPNNQKDGKPLSPIEVEEGTPYNLLQCVLNVLDTNLESCWRFDGVSIPLEKKSLKKLMKMGKSWLDDGIVAVALEVLCQGYPLWGTAEPLALVSLNAASKAFKNIIKVHTELGKSDFVLLIHQDCNHWILFHLNILFRRIVCYDSLSRCEHAATKTYNICAPLMVELSSRFAHIVSDVEHPFEFIVSKDVPRQKDSINCGVYMVAFAWYLLCHGRPLCSEDKF